MLHEFLTHLSDWGTLDTWTVVTAALAAMACALPGVYLVLRRQSMMGDALSHTSLLGIVLAFLLAHRLQTSGLISSATDDTAMHGFMFLGAMLVGVFAAVLSEAIRKIGAVEASAALGIVFTSIFALGLLLIRMAADSVHIDPDCVFYGTIETVVIDTVGSTGIPRAAIVNGGMLCVNLFLLLLFYKELRISTFDPALATALGINAPLLNYALMAVTAATLVAAFRSVGSILVIAMLIVPAATAHLLTDRLSRLVALSLVVAAASAVFGHVLAITLPPIVFSRLGFPEVKDAGTAGMMAATAGLLLVLSVLFAPRHGIVSKVVQRSRLTLRIVGEDMLGFLFRVEESGNAAAKAGVAAPVAAAEGVAGIGPLLRKLSFWQLRWQGKITRVAAGYHLTEAGRRAAENLVRAHRLWESYMEKHFQLPEDHLHETAALVEHYIGPEIQQELAEELDQPGRDPHGRDIPTR